VSLAVIRIASSALMVFLASLTLTFAQTPVNPSPLPAPLPLFDLPKNLTLCQERVPLERQDVWESLDQAMIVSVYHHSQVLLWIKRSQRFFPYIEQKLRERGMPDDLKYMAVVESSLKTYAVSNAKAVGPWQFTKGTAQKYGLRVDKWYDQRLNFEQSTDAALTYLSELYAMFGNWGMAIAAYNCGENRMIRSVKTQEFQHYYDADLPLETEAYLFRILAAKLILSKPETYGYLVPERRRYPPLAYDRVEVVLTSETPVLTLARACGTTYKTVKELNPEILQDAVPAGRVRLKIPKGKAAAFQSVFPDAVTL
jgi:hypothetical protein